MFTVTASASFEPASAAALKKAVVCVFVLLTPMPDSAAFSGAAAVPT